MPSEQEHLAIYQHTWELINEDLFDPDNTQYSDWFITIAFYNVVHLIEERLAKNGRSNQHPETHYERNIEMNKDPYFKPVRNKYYTLYQASRKTRYKGRQYNKLYLKSAINMVKEIEQYIHA